MESVIDNQMDVIKTFKTYQQAKSFKKKMQRRYRSKWFGTMSLNKNGKYARSKKYFANGDKKG